MQMRHLTADTGRLRVSVCSGPCKACTWVVLFGGEKDLSV